MEQVQVLAGLILLGAMWFVGFVSYWKGHKDGYWKGFNDCTILSKYGKGGTK